MIQSNTSREYQNVSIKYNAASTFNNRLFQKHCTCKYILKEIFSDISEGGYMYDKIIYISFCSNSYEMRNFRA